MLISPFTNSTVEFSINLLFAVWSATGIHRFFHNLLHSFCGKPVDAQPGSLVMKLQLALDRPDLTRELELARQVDRYVDLIEAGTPLLIREGIRAVRELRRRHRGTMIVADIKVIDAGEPIAELAFAAGANVVTVLGCASNEVIDRVVRSAQRYDGEVMADSLSVPDIARRHARTARAGCHFTLHQQAWIQEAQERSGRDIATARGAGRRGSSARLSCRRNRCG